MVKILQKESCPMPSFSGISAGHGLSRLRVQLYNKGLHEQGRLAVQESRKKMNAIKQELNKEPVGALDLDNLETEDESLDSLIAWLLMVLLIVWILVIIGFYEASAWMS